ncbi:MAG: virulence factor SrfC family protein [Aeromonas sp.]
MQTPQQILTNGWQTIEDRTLDALNWVNVVRHDSHRLDNEADKLNLGLYRARNLATSLKRVAGTPMTVGFFGISQAGKSYLISALAAGHNGALEGRYGAQSVDFIKEVNPVGGGKEATGLVTRFTRAPNAAPAHFPVPLQLFSEIDLAKILANTWFNDFNHELLSYQLDEACINARLQPFEQRPINPIANNGVSSEDVVALWDYLNGSFKKSVQKLEHSYWPRVLKLAPTLTPAERADLFSLLWGELPELTEIYRNLAMSLAHLGHAKTVYAPLDCLLSQGHGGVSIMNVDSLSLLGSPQDRVIEICSVTDDGQHISSSIAQAQLAALTTELIFPMVEGPVDSLVEQVDLLDFPGYRGRLSISQLAEAATAGGSAVSQLLLRGKVAYLFERYTDNQEMNALVVCASSAKQSDVTSVGPVLTRWVEKTQGHNAIERQGHKPGLFWALTMFDMRINSGLNLTPAQLKEGWDGLMQQTLLERFGQYDWIQEWAPSKPFSNCFLVRKPGMPVPFLSLDGNKETAVVPQYADILQQMASSFVSGKGVAQHVADPAGAWQAMLSLNDGGIGRLSSELRGVAHLEFKLDRIALQLQAKRKELAEQLLGRWFEQDGDGQAAQKRQIAQQLWNGLGVRVSSLGELISQLELPSSELSNIYLSIREHVANEMGAQSSPQSLNGNEAANPFAANPFGGSPFGDSPFGSPAADDLTAPATSAAVKAQEPVGQDDQFAREVFKAWVAHLRDLSTQQTLLTQLGIEAQLIDLLTQELITAANRLDLEGMLKRSLAGPEQTGVRREQLLARQVMKVQFALRDFVAWFGFLSMPIEKVPNSFAADKGKLFARTAQIAPHELPCLTLEAPKPAMAFLGDWLSCVVLITQDNVGHSATRDISFEHNQRLGQIIHQFTQESAPC